MMRSMTMPEYHIALIIKQSKLKKPTPSQIMTEKAAKAGIWPETMKLKSYLG